MGKKLDALLMRKTFKTDKFKATVALAISRLAVIKNQRQARCSIARSDVVEFLNLSNQERALLRVEQVIKEQNMLDVLVLLEGYCQLFLERVNLIEHEKVCPEELHEAVSSLIYASTRCGDFPELQEIRVIFALRFGREFAARAVELRNNCGVNPKVIQKLSTRMPSLENKMKMLKDIASDNNIVVHLPVDSTVSDTPMELKESNPEEKQMPGPSRIARQDENLSSHPDEDGIDTPVRRKYKDVADAAQAAFESAAYAAAAARAAVELSRSGPTAPTDDDDDSYAPGKTVLRNGGEDVIVRVEAKTPHSDYSFGDNVKGDGESGDSEIVFDGSDDDGDGSKRVDENDHNSQFDAEEMDEPKEALNINRRPISVRTARKR